MAPALPVTIHTGWQPGLIGRITEMHSRFYAQKSGFGSYFESKVASGLAEFVLRLDRPCNRIWSAVSGHSILGSIAIDGEDLGSDIAHLRWFIMDDALRGSGMGKAILAQALAFCDAQGFAETHLWTFQGLDAARKLYESHGFVLAESFPGDQWGREVTEQRFQRSRQ